MVTGNDNSQYPNRNPNSWSIYGCNSNSIPDKDYEGWNKIASVTNDTVLRNANTNQFFSVFKMNRLNINIICFA